MKKSILLSLTCLLTLALTTQATPPKFTKAPTAKKTGAGATISFAVDQETDVAVYIEDAAGKITERATRGDQRAQHDHPIGGENLGQLGRAPNVFQTVIVSKIQIAIQSGAQVVAIEADTEAAFVVEHLLKRGGNRRLSGSGKTTEPKNAALLAKEDLLGVTRESRVGVDVGDHELQ